MQTNPCLLTLSSLIFSRGCQQMPYRRRTRFYCGFGLRLLSGPGGEPAVLASRITAAAAAPPLRYALQKGTMSISMREIAKLAGVSSATVSRVINGSSAVTTDTTARIQKIIRDLNFVPNRSAVQLKNGKSQIYGIFIPDLT